MCGKHIMYVIAVSYVVSKVVLLCGYTRFFFAEYLHLIKKDSMFVRQFRKELSSFQYL